MDRPTTAERPSNLSKKKGPSLPSITTLGLPPRSRSLDTPRQLPIAPKPPETPTLQFTFGDNQQVFLDGLELVEYDIVGKTYTMQRPLNETHSLIQRKTIDGRTLQYELTIKQQPEKARACGAGPRSAADRRPVDPPPIVELRIFELPGQDAKKEITMGYDASFMLHASLEAARPIANGMRHSAPMHPVLTGVPVAGAAYLDRPEPAAWFIFADLSVRHEGWFRLRFQLFEKVKNPADADFDKPLSNEQNGDEPNTGMHNRMEVVSTPFQVYSAKKFPGLSESTVLSRIVAEQGCRVRIRRDVRVRRNQRDSGDAEEDGLSHCCDTSAPPTPIDRGVSISRPEFSRGPTDQYHCQSIDSSLTTFQPRPSIDSPAMPLTGVYPPPLRSTPTPDAAVALIHMSQSGAQSSDMPPPMQPAPSLSGPSTKPSYPSVPDVRAVPEVIIPEISSQHSEPVMHNYTYNAVGRYYDLPEFSAKKRTRRSISPRSEESHERQRPKLDETSPAIGSHSPWVEPAGSFKPALPSIAAMVNTETPFIASIVHQEALNASDDYESDDSEIFSFNYKRADGTISQKPVEQMRRQYTTQTSAS